MSPQAQSEDLLKSTGSNTALESHDSEYEKHEACRTGQEAEIDLLKRPKTREDAEDNSEIGSTNPERIEAKKAIGMEDVMTESGQGLEKPMRNLTASATRDNPPLTDSHRLAQEAEPDGSQSTETSPQDYLDPTPKTPRQEISPSRTPNDETKALGDVNPDSEIQSIMEQFERDDGIEGEETKWADTEIELAATVQHPPRRSSLLPIEPISLRKEPDNVSENVDNRGIQVSAREAVYPHRHSSLPQTPRVGAAQDSASPSSVPLSLPKMPPPAPDPESDLPFDFHRFLEQLRDKSADPVAKYLRSFLVEFGRKQWMVHEQVKLINDFLTFITNKMGRCAVWRDVSEAEFDNAKEGMEKLVMNRLYTQTFSPAIPPPTPASTSKGKRKIIDKNLEPGRRGQHQEDIERDDILGQKIRIYGWIQETHLDIQRVGDNGRRFLLLAQQELLKIKSYRAPRDKIICVLNCCKVIFGILRNSKSSDTSADSFVPLLIYVVLHANPDHLVSNVQYILRFRNQDKLGGEAGYYLSSLMGAIQFIENLDRTSLTVSDEDFERNVEAAVSAIAEKHQEKVPQSVPRGPQPPKAPTSGHLSEKSGPSMPEVVPRNSIDAEYSSPRKSPYLRGRPGDDDDGAQDDNTAVGGLLRTIQKPLSSIGRLFTDDPGQGFTPNNSRLVPNPQSSPRLSPAVFQPPKQSEDVDGRAERPQTLPAGERPSILSSKSLSNEEGAGKLSAEDAASRQASAEAAEAQRIQRAEHHNIVETLAGMFPDLDKDVIDDVVRQKQGRVGLAVDACLALNN